MVCFPFGFKCPHPLFSLLVSRFWKATVLTFFKKTKLALFTDIYYKELVYVYMVNLRTAKLMYEIEGHQRDFYITLKTLVHSGL